VAQLDAFEAVERVDQSPTFLMDSIQSYHDTSLEKVHEEREEIGCL